MHIQVQIPMVQTVQRRACWVLERSASTSVLASFLRVPRNITSNHKPACQATLKRDVPRQVEVPQLQYEDQVVQIPVQKQVHVPMVQQVQRRALRRSAVLLLLVLLGLGVGI